jgi:hypothetical protein
MYVFLLVLGVAITAAGIVLLAPGLPILGQGFDASIITPGAVAVVGGLILIGLGLAIRVLGRIERALAARQLPRTVRPTETLADTSTTQEQSTPAPIPFPTKPTTEPRQQTPAAAAAAAPSDDAVLERFREKFPTLVRLDNASVVEETDVSLSPQPPVRVDEEAGEIDNAAASGQANGAAPATRTVRRLDVTPRPSGRAERAKSFDAFLPTRQRPGREAPQTATVQPVTPVLPAEPAPDVHPAVPAFQAPGPVPVSVLKSGVVDGMAYTLYSDGSIEAALPQGTLRFGSITELRNHIEQAS